MNRWKDRNDVFMCSRKCTLIVHNFHLIIQEGFFPHHQKICIYLLHIALHHHHQHHLNEITFYIQVSSRFEFTHETRHNNSHKDTSFNVIFANVSLASLQVEFMIVYSENHIAKIFSNAKMSHCELWETNYRLSRMNWSKSHHVFWEFFL